MQDKEVELSCCHMVFGRSREGRGIIRDGTHEDWKVFISLLIALSEIAAKEIESVKLSRVQTSLLTLFGARETQ